jgi:integrase
MNQNLNDLFKLYLRDLKRRKCKTINKIQQTYDNNIAPSLGDKLITDIIRGDIASLHFDISERAPYIANKCLTVLKSMFNLAITLSLVDNNPATHIGKNRENKRKRYLTNDELLKIVGEMNRLQDRIIYLAPQAMKIVESLPRDNDYIIGIKTPRRTWETILKNTGITNVRLHDIRHSYASWSLQVVKLSEVGDLLGHRDQATTQRYAHIHQEQSIANANKVGSHIENLITSSTRNLYQKQSG